MTISATAAMTVAWPVWLITSMHSLDNAWLVATERAKLAGKCLAHVLADRNVVGQRPVTLIGHSMGARLIFYCLLELYRMGEFHAVYDVVLLGAPVTTKSSDWKCARSVVANRIVNCYLQRDWVLAFFYRYLEWGLQVAGLSCVDVPGVENVDLSSLSINGHTDYSKNVDNILAKVHLLGMGGPRSAGGFEC